MRWMPARTEAVITSGLKVSTESPDVEAPGKRFDHQHHPLQLLVSTDLRRTGPR